MSIMRIPDNDPLVKEACDAFQRTYDCIPNVGACAPGRVNLIGEHTDYNEGFVFPVALPLVTLVVGKANESSTCRVTTLADGADEPRSVELPTLEKLKPGKPLWSNYIKGVMDNFPGAICGFDAVIISTVPLGGGLSSSAALEVAFYTFLEMITGHKAESLKSKALACQKAEHEFAKMPCGIMDQFISTMGEEGHGLLIDCRSLEAVSIPVVDSSIIFLITNCNVRHELTGTEYPERRLLCCEAASQMGQKSLRNITMDNLEVQKSFLSSEMFSCARHVVTEISRTQEAVTALQCRDYETFGKLMNDSHASLRDDFKVSCFELDQLVDLALQVPGVYGTRMTGGGFGGCTVTLVREDALENLMIHINKGYAGTATFYRCKPSAGAKGFKI